MPNTESAKKRQRQNEVRRVYNRAIRSTIKTDVRKVRDAITAGNLESGQQQFRLTTKKLDKATAKGAIHANAAGRIKSRLSAALKRVKQKA